MRRGWLLTGAAVAVVGLLLAYFPLTEQVSGPRFIASVNSQYVIDYQAPLDLLFPRVEFTVGWIATDDATNVTVLSCGGDAACAVPAAAPLAVGHGLFGNLSFVGSANAYFEILPTGGGANVTVRYTTPLLGGAVGFAGLLGGVGLFSFGLTGGGRPPPADEEDGAGPSAGPSS
jgi:hypothetical protein